MDDSFTDLEKELQRLRPVNPSADMIAQIEHQLSSQPARVAAKWMWWAVPLATAAVFVFVFRYSGAEPRGPVVTREGAGSPAVFQVVGSENVLLNARDEGVTTLPDGTPARRVRETYLATVVWKDPKSDASLKWTVPREEFRIIPVSVQ